MILVDTNNMFFSEFLEYHQRTGEQMSMDLVRRLGVSKISRELKAHKAFGAGVLCHDDRKYWRREIFPHYKAARKKGRDDSSFDWNAFFPLYEKFLEEIAENLPVASVRASGAEADDIIAILAPRFAPVEPVLIWSSDTDDLQLQQMEPRIKQYSYIKKKMITPKSENYSLLEHIVRGDTGDGIPNIKSTSDHLVRSAAAEKTIRQKPIMAADLQDWENHGIRNAEKFCTTPEMLARFRENERLIDYRHIPNDVAQRIIEAYEVADAKRPRGKVFNYLVEKQLNNVLRDGF